MSVEQGMDVERCKDIADELKRLGSRLGDIGGDGSSLRSTLVETWSGPDCERLFVDWTFTGRPQIDRSSGDITRFSEDLRTQAVEQDLVSDLAGPLEGTSTAKSAWDRAKDGLVDKMRGAAKFVSDTVDKYPILYAAPGANGVGAKMWAGTVNSAADWIDDPNQAKDDWLKKPRVEQGADVISVVPVGRVLGAAARGAKGLMKGGEAVNDADKVVDGAKHAPDAPKKPDDSVENRAQSEGAPPKKADEGTSDGAKNSDDRTREEIREHGGGAREMADRRRTTFLPMRRCRRSTLRTQRTSGWRATTTRRTARSFGAETGLVTARQPNGDFISGWKASPDQARNIQERGSLQ